MTTTSRQAEKIDSIQLLRAIAAIAVVAHHIPLIGNGAWGVDLFFVISGFIMCYVSAESDDHFLLKRAIRVVPLYWIGTLGVFAVALVMPSLVKATQPDFVHLVKSLLFIPFQKGELVQPVLFLGWTLNYEVFFYIVFAASMRISHQWRAAICSAFLATCVVTGWLAQSDSVLLNFYTSSILLEFILGMGCYAFYSRVVRMPLDYARLGMRIALICVGLIALALLPLASLHISTVERAYYRGPLASVAFICIVLGLRTTALPAVLVLLGDASYSLYLFHPYILEVCIKIFRPFAEPGAYAWMMAALAVLLCCAASLLCYRLIEAPLTIALRRRLLRRQSPRPLQMQNA